MPYYRVTRTIEQELFARDVHQHIVDAVMVLDEGHHRIKAIKLIRAIYDIGLLEAKLLTERIIESETTRHRR